MQQWISQFFTRSEVLKACRANLNWPDWSDWPSEEALNQLAPEDFKNSQNLPLTFWAEDEFLPHASLYYEERIYHHGIISTRIGNWHDLFNAFIWLTFPNTKNSINKIHVQELAQQQTRQRSKRRDLLTHFDESGVLLVYQDDDFLKALKAHDWETVFVKRREEWHHTVLPYVFGHGLLEKALNPYIGFTGKALLLKVEKAFYNWPKQKQLSWLDAQMADGIAQGTLLMDKRELTPLPLLGVPGWWADNSDPDFYKNRDYFRPKRKHY